MTEKELLAYAIRGMRADVVEKANAVRQSMIRMKEAFDKSPTDSAVRSRFKPVVDSLMESLVAFDESMAKAETFSRENYQKGGANHAGTN